MENQPKLNSSKEVIAFLAERFPQCFSAEGEARPLKIGIFQDLVERVGGEMNLSKTQLRAALRLYTSSWRYLYGVFTLAANAFILLACGRSGFAFFRLLGCALRLNASFRFFQLLTRMGNVLLFQLHYVSTRPAGVICTA